MGQRTGGDENGLRDLDTSLRASAILGSYESNYSDLAGFNVCIRVAQ